MLFRSRFKYTSDKIPFSYANLVEDIGLAIDKQAEEDGGKYVTDTRENIYEEKKSELDFDALMNKFQDITTKMVADDAPYFAPRITEIAERHLGQGKKVGEISRAQVMLLDIIVDELKDLGSKYQADE